MPALTDEERALVEAFRPRIVAYVRKLFGHNSWRSLDVEDCIQAGLTGVMAKVSAWRGKAPTGEQLERAVLLVARRAAAEYVVTHRQACRIPYKQWDNARSGFERMSADTRGKLQRGARPRELAAAAYVGGIRRGRQGRRRMRTAEDETRPRGWLEGREAVHAAVLEQAALLDGAAGRAAAILADETLPVSVPEFRTSTYEIGRRSGLTRNQVLALQGRLLDRARRALDGGGASSRSSVGELRAALEAGGEAARRAVFGAVSAFVGRQAMPAVLVASVKLCGPQDVVPASYRELAAIAGEPRQYVKAIGERLVRRALAAIRGRAA